MKTIVFYALFLFLGAMLFQSCVVSPYPRPYYHNHHRPYGYYRNPGYARPHIYHAPRHYNNHYRPHHPRW